MIVRLTGPLAVIARSFWGGYNTMMHELESVLWKSIKVIVSYKTLKRQTLSEGWINDLVYLNEKQQQQQNKFSGKFNNTEDP